MAQYSAAPTAKTINGGRAAGSIQGSSADGAASGKAHFASCNKSHIRQTQIAAITSHRQNRPRPTFIFGAFGAAGPAKQIMTALPAFISARSEPSMSSLIHAADFRA